MVECPREWCPARCHACGIQTTERASLTGHLTSTECHRRFEVRGQRRAAATSHAALDVTFKAYETETLKRVELFKYLGR